MKFSAQKENRNDKKPALLYPYSYVFIAQCFLFVVYLLRPVVVRNKLCKMYKIY